MRTVRGSSRLCWWVCFSACWDTNPPGPGTPREQTPPGPGTPPPDIYSVSNGTYNTWSIFSRKTRKHSNRMYTTRLLTGKGVLSGGGAVQGGDAVRQGGVLLSRKGAAVWGWCCPGGAAVHGAVRPWGWCCLGCGSVWGWCCPGGGSVQRGSIVQGVVLSRGWCCPGGGAVHGGWCCPWEWCCPGGAVWGMLSGGVLSSEGVLSITGSDIITPPSPCDRMTYTDTR